MESPAHPHRSLYPFYLTFDGNLISDEIEPPLSSPPQRRARVITEISELPSRKKITEIPESPSRKKAKEEEMDEEWEWEFTNRPKKKNTRYTPYRRERSNTSFNRPESRSDDESKYDLLQESIWYF